MKKLLFLISLVLISNLFAVEKFYYTNDGWFGPWPVEQAESNGSFINTPNGLPVCEATIFENDRPISIKWLKLNGDNTIKCPVELDQTRKDADLAKQAQDAQIATVLANMRKGEKVIAFVNLRNVSKGLTQEQVTQFVSDFASIKSLLETGSLATARTAILALPVNEALTQEDKDAVIAYMDTL